MKNAKKYTKGKIVNKIRIHFKLKYLKQMELSSELLGSIKLLFFALILSCEILDIWVLHNAKHRNGCRYLLITLNFRSC